MGLRKGVAVDGTLTEAEVKAAGIFDVAVVVASDCFVPFVRIDRGPRWFGIRTVQSRPALVKYRYFENLLGKLRGEPVDGAKSGWGWEGNEITLVIPPHPLIERFGPAAREWSDA